MRVPDAVRRHVASVVLCAWLTVTYSVLWLAAWTVVPVLLTDWTPRVISSGSMEPALRRGDVVLSDPADDGDLRPGRIITFVDPSHAGETVTHRIATVNDDGTVETKGDANAGHDSTPIHARDVVGVGKALVPTIGLPALWLRDGQPWLAVLALVVFAAGFAAAHPRTDPSTTPTTTRPARERRRSHPPKPAAPGPLLRTAARAEAHLSRLSRRLPSGRGFVSFWLLVAMTGMTLSVAAALGLSEEPARAAFSDTTGNADNSFAAASTWATYAEEVLADGPVAHWRLGEAAGATIAVDEQGVHDAPYDGTPTLEASPLLFRDTDTAVGFDGDDRVLVANHADINTASSYATKTVELLFSATDVNTRQVLWEEGGASNGMNVYLDGGSLYTRAWSEAQAWSTKLSVSAPVLADTTYHVAAVLDATGTKTLTLYVNGTAAASASKTDANALASHSGETAIGGMATATEFHDGDDSSGTSHLFAGTVDEVAHYSTALSGTRVQVHANLAVGPDVTPPSAPTLSGTAGDTSAGLSWTAVNDPSTPVTYQLYRDSVLVYDGASTSHTDTGLTNDTTYMYTVRATDGAGNQSGDSNSVPVIPQAQAGCPTPGPQILQSVADAVVDDSNPSVNFGASANNFGTQTKGGIRRSLVAFDLPTISTGCIMTSATLRMTVGAAGGHSGEMIRAYAAASTWTEMGVTWNTQPLTSGSPASTASSATPGAVLQWDVTSIVDGMYTGTNHGFLVQHVGEGGGPQRTQHLEPREAANPPELVITLDDAPAPPTAPSGLAAAAASSARIDLSWTDNADDENGFKIERSPGGAGTWTEIGTAPADATSYASTGLASDTTYDYRVRAYNGVGDSPYSNVASATTNVSACASPGSQTVYAVADALVYEGAPSTNYGTDLGTFGTRSDSAGDARSLVRFNLPATPADCTVFSATLRFTAVSATTAGRTLEAWPVSGAWTETGVTWGTQPGTTGTPATTTSVASGTIEWDVTAIVQAMYAGSNDGFLLRDAAENAATAQDQTLRPREASAAPDTTGDPELVVVFE